jgi:hypothetical protein
MSSVLAVVAESLSHFTRVLLKPNDLSYGKVELQPQRDVPTAYDLTSRNYQGHWTVLVIQLGAGGNASLVPASQRYLARGKLSIGFSPRGA